MIIYFASFSSGNWKKYLKTQDKFYLQINKTNQGTDFIFSEIQIEGYILLWMVFGRIEYKDFMRMLS